MTAKTPEERKVYATLSDIDRRRTDLFFVSFSFKDTYVPNYDGKALGGFRRFVWPVLFNTKEDVETVTTILCDKNLMWDHEVLPGVRGKVKSFTVERTSSSSAFARACADWASKKPFKLATMGRMELVELLPFTDPFK